MVWLLQRKVTAAELIEMGFHVFWPPSYRKCNKRSEKEEI